MRRLQLAWLGASLSIWAFAIALGVYAFDVGAPPPSAWPRWSRLLPGALASPLAGLLGDRYARRSEYCSSALRATAVLACATAAAALGAPRALCSRLGAVHGCRQPLRSDRGGADAGGGANPAGAVGRQRRAQRHGQSGLSGRLGDGRDPADHHQPEVAFGLAAAAGGVSAALLVGLGRDRRPGLRRFARRGWRPRRDGGGQGRCWPTERSE